MNSDEDEDEDGNDHAAEISKPSSLVARGRTWGFAVVRNPTSRAAATTHIEFKEVRKNNTEVSIRDYLAFDARAFFHQNCLATPTQLEKNKSLSFYDRSLDVLQIMNHKPQTVGTEL
ncbi:hypothetical protein AVEN_8713-1 [Araneus ventricosus]|uniref:Uncharacterized protein n=1 Tax=Araneus ventricosus TaxID=182803 RepID=A0A4Y2GDE6_ARAVE|nr:hypothetical protein AVEN_8713-1 [Araneus ventricosus]